MKANVLALAILLLGSTTVWSQIKVSTISDVTDSAWKAIMMALRSKIVEHPKQFTLVDSKDTELSLLVTSDCILRIQKTESFACFYTTSYAGETTKTFMGGGIYAASTADEVADNFLASAAQNIVERWNQMVRDNAVDHLELIESHGGIFVSARICELGVYLVRGTENS